MEPNAYAIAFSRMGPTVYVGPFASLEACYEFLKKHRLQGMIFGLQSPEQSFEAGAEVWL